MREKVFIGSSTESLNYAQVVKKQLEPEYDCIIWNIKFFDLNISTYENLYRKAYGFDFAIFVGGKDSIVFERRGLKRKPRDNVTFELGLYAGIISPARTFFLLNKKCKLFSDYCGNTIGFYANENDLIKRCDEIREHMIKESRISRPSAMPATALAMSYYNNFITNIHKCFATNAKFKVNGVNYSFKEMEVLIYVCLPEKPISRMNAIDSHFYNKNNLTQISVSYEEDKRGLYLRIDKGEVEAKRLIIYDVPTILDTSFDIVEKLDGKDYVGNSERIFFLRQKELRDFKKTLEFQASDNPWFKEKLKFKEID